LAPNANHLPSVDDFEYWDGFVFFRNLLALWNSIDRFGKVMPGFRGAVHLASDPRHYLSQSKRETLCDLLARKAAEDSNKRDLPSDR
jgi:hypothetical protein